MEGVSFDKSSDEDDNEVVEQSLMQLYADSSSESSDDNENHSDLHVLVLEQWFPRDFCSDPIIGLRVRPATHKKKFLF